MTHQYVHDILNISKNYFHESYKICRSLHVSKLRMRDEKNYFSLYLVLTVL